MTYARVHDQAVADEYYAAMARVDERLDIVVGKEESASASQRAQLQELLTQLAEPTLSVELRLEMVAQIRLLLVSAPPAAYDSVFR